MRRTRLVWPILCWGLASCSAGTKVDHFHPAHEPDGAQVRLEIGKSGTPALGELLAVRDTALLIREGTTIELVPLPLIRHGQATAPGSRAWFSNGKMRASTRERLRLLSRYPKGVTAELLRQLLDAYGQADLHVVSP